MQSFIDASSAGTGPEATSWMAPKLSGIVSTYVGVSVCPTGPQAIVYTSNMYFEVFTSL